MLNKQLNKKYTRTCTGTQRKNKSSNGQCVYFIAIFSLLFPFRHLCVLHVCVYLYQRICMCWLTGRILCVHFEFFLAVSRCMYIGLALIRERFLMSMFVGFYRFSLHPSSSYVPLSLSFFFKFDLYTIRHVCMCLKFLSNLMWGALQQRKK